MLLRYPPIITVIVLVLASCSTEPASESASQTRRPSDWHFVQRTYPYFEADKTVYHQALEIIKARKQLAKSARTSWIPAGPVNAGGRIVDIEFDPLRPDTVYAGAATGGVYKSIDSGISWFPVFDDQGILTIGDIAVDPVDSDIVYAGTGEANGGHNNFAGGGLYKSTDAGLTWQYSGLLETTSIGRVVVDHQNSDRVFVAAAGSYFSPDPARGLYRSDDAGESWQQVLFIDDSTGVVDVVQKPDDANVLLAAGWERVRRPDGPTFLYGNGSGIYRSSDGGDTWSKLGPGDGLPDPDLLQDGTGRATIGRIGLSFSQSNPQIVYALYTDGFFYLGLYRSTDGGSSWTDVDPNDQLASIDAGFSWYFGQVRVSPTDPDLVFALDVRLARSENGASSWTTTAGTHVDYHALTFDPEDPDRVLAGNDGGIAISTSAGSSWIPVGNLPITQFYEINFDAANPDRLIGGTQDNGTWISDGNDSWSKLWGADGFYAIIDPTDPNIVYVEEQNGVLYKSTNGGVTFSSALNGINGGEDRNWSTPVILDPSNPAVLYYGTDKLYRSTDRAANWVAASPRLAASAPGSRLGTVTTIAVAPSNPNVIYAGTDDGKVWVTQDYGQNWTDVTAGLPLRWVTRVAVSANDPSTAYVTFSGLKWRDPQPHVFRTRDGGASWEDISSDLPDLPVNALALDPVNAAVVYIGTDIGAFVTEDGGASWDILGENLPAVPVYDLKYIDSTRELIAGTHGRSAYRLDVSAYSTNIEHPDVASRDRLQMYPNPFGPSLTIEWDESGLPVDVSVYDVLGRRVWKASGVTEGASTWQPDALTAAGVYLVRITESRRPHRTIATGNALLVR